jgi:hypothetical protein
MRLSRMMALFWFPVLGACGDAPTSAGAACEDPPYFTVIPVALDDINAITVIGGLGAPGHTLPTAHAGIYLARPGVPVISPGNIEVTRLRRVTYPTVGLTDYAVEYSVCRDITGWFGHLLTLSSSLAEQDVNWGDCRTYEAAGAPIETCTSSPLSLSLAAGDAIGTAAPGFDVGLLDGRVNHYYVSPERFPPAMFHSICPWEQFDAPAQSLLFSRLRDPGQAFAPASGTPRCGSMQVDVNGTAKGVWAEQGVTGPVAGDERQYITLADHPYRPQEKLALSLGPSTLGATVAVVPRLTSGRVNRAFEHLTADGTTYCYGPNQGNQGNRSSWFISLSSPTQLSIEQVVHAVGASPCLADPSTWTPGSARLTMVR